jgi:hypothetical protein
LEEAFIESKSLCFEGGQKEDPLPDTQLFDWGNAQSPLKEMSIVEACDVRLGSRFVISILWGFSEGLCKWQMCSTNFDTHIL